MSCDRYEAFQLGKLDEPSFMSHAETCAACRGAREADEGILSEAGKLKIPVETEGLWYRIQAELLKEMNRRPALATRPALLSMAAVVALALGISAFLMISRNRSLLDPLLLALVEKRENAYMRAIDQLDETTDDRLEQLNVALMLLYRERLRTIDDQIALCRETLATNPASAHIRRTLFAALKQKKETLLEIMISSGASEAGNGNT